MNRKALSYRNIIYRVRLTATGAYRAIPARAYKSFLAQFFARKNYLTQFHELALSGTALTNRISSDLASRSSLKPNVIAFELLDDTVSPSDLDHVAVIIEQVLRTKKISKPKWLLLVVQGRKDSSSVLIEKMLVPLTQKAGVGLVIAFATAGIQPLIRVLPRNAAVDKPKLRALVGSESKGQQTERAVSDLVSDQIKVVFGHFEIDTGAHVPCVVSLRGMSASDELVSGLRTELLQFMSEREFEIAYSGINGSGIEELAYALAGPDRHNVRHLNEPNGNDRPLMVLYDTLRSRGQLDADLRNVAKNRKVVVVAITYFQDYQIPPSIPHKLLISLPYKEAASKNLCSLCMHSPDATYVIGSHIRDFERNISEFDPVTFWELIASDPTFYSVGHWISESRTKYHYHLRIMPELFRVHGYGFALRMRKLLVTRGVFPQWVNRIVCADEAESSVLADRLAEVLPLPRQAVIRIPRAHFDRIAGTQLDQVLLDQIMSRSIQRSLSETNVVIVDQAAHHFKTLSRLATLCRFMHSNVLAFAVVVNRVSPDIDLIEYLPSSHYVSLYSWPSWPQRPEECPCYQGQA